MYFIHFYKFSVTCLNFYRNRVTQIEMLVKYESSQVTRLVHALNRKENIKNLRKLSLECSHFSNLLKRYYKITQILNNIS